MLAQVCTESKKEEIFCLANAEKGDCREQQFFTKHD